ncbi:putative ABC transporter ATP-binding protein YbhF [Marinomonas aquimarina]|uniref:Putative ABC transporter ATP-binding protein YbhF n=1 Tax=Marinomonas aquimarina TaxID=295068 RepID=A0A1A8T6K5_9GAMM|nr:ABC transporter ATP-binding protein [Marinomonas aquimarina]SBS28092.1 putative ABC transporter ATP-binding protein YbhF [Marinomonas aquimarina]
MSQERVIESHGLTKQFGDNLAVNGLDLSITQGTIYGFLGPNGCGKSTAIRMLTGLLEPTSGAVTLFGQPIKHHEESLKQRIGYMTQKFSLYDNLTVLENLRFVASIYGLGRQQRKARIQELIQLYELGALTKQLAGAMSGGQKQRLALACATLHQPELLFLDEPTSAVDPENRRDFWEHLFDLSDQGTTILVSTHYMDEAERCHALAILENGHKRADGTPQQLMNDMPATVFETQGPQLRQLKQQLVSHPEILSAAQVGTRLRVLVNKTCAQPATLLHTLGAEYCFDEVRPSLEDVFVANTGGRHVG